MKDYSKYIGYILFVATIVVWIFNFGKKYTEIELKIEKLVQEQKETNELLFEQQVLNGKILQWMEDH